MRMRPTHPPGGVSPLIKDHLAGGASRLAALLLPQILPVFTPPCTFRTVGARRVVVAPFMPGPPRRVLCAAGWRPGAALRDLVLVQRRHATSGKVTADGAPAPTARVPPSKFARKAGYRRET
jgi:hypothetical protein